MTRHFREGTGHSGIVPGWGNLILDQADYLRRCDFNHVEIAPGVLAQWQRSQSLSLPPIQQIVSGRRARDSNMATY